MKRMINESNLQTAYHFTSIESLLSMLRSNRIDLSIAYGYDGEERFSEGKYPFFLSTTQYKTPKLGYQSKFVDTFARLELNTRFMSSQGKFKRIMFFDYEEQDMRDTAGHPNFEYQSEDRFLSKKSYIDFSKTAHSVTLIVDDTEVPKEVYSRLEKLGIPYKTIGDEYAPYKYEHNSNYNDTDSPIAVAILKAIESIWGEAARKEAMERAKPFIPTNIEDFWSASEIPQYALYKSYAKAMLMPYIVKYMADKITSRQLIKDLNNTLQDEN